MSDLDEGSMPRKTMMDEWLEQHPGQQPPAMAIEHSPSPILVRELVALVLLVVLCDLTIYRSNGFAGPGALFLIAPVLLTLGTVKRKAKSATILIMLMLVVLSVRLLWCGSYLAVGCGFVLLSCFAMSLAGLTPYLTRALLFASQLLVAGHRGISHYLHSLSRFQLAIQRPLLLAVALPIATAVTFSTIFVMANPDLVKSFGRNLGHFAELLQQWVEHFQFTEVLFCLGAAWLGVGCFRPDVNPFHSTDHPPLATSERAESPLYAAYRNTLVMVIALFAIYLVFEFQTLWFKTFPKGFYYSGYAHEGATWLTVALGLATVILSLIFRGTVLADPRLHRLRLLSWIWSIQNLLLAVSVYNRLFIYIGFNGMTRMRVIGILGVASVIVGFLLVLIKIARNCDFTWLIRRQLWTVALAMYLYAVLPVDAFVNQYNVNRILAGNPAPSVQISVHPTSDEGYLALLPLLDCSDPIIHAGMHARLYDKLVLLEDPAIHRLGWTARQVATDRLREQLQQRRAAKTGALGGTATAQQREADLKRFQDYAYQWY